MSGLDHLMPTYDFSERHHRLIEASPEQVWRALTELSLAQLSITRPLVGIRGLGRKRGRLDQPLFTHGPVTMLLVNEPWCAVGGAIGRPWQLSPTHHTVSTLDDFLEFEEPGWATYLTDFRLRPSDRSGGGTVLSTETRVSCTDTRSRRRFGWYWLLIRPFSGLIRRDMLASAGRIAVAAERAAGPGMPAAA